MKPKSSHPWRRLLPAVFAAPVVLLSCVVAVPEHESMMDGRYDDEVYVNEAPPPVRTEVVVGTAPSPSYVWVDGYWARHRSDWYWVKGRWSARPRPHASWEPGHWDRRSRGHVWVHGRWR